MTTLSIAGRASDTATAPPGPGTWSTVREGLALAPEATRGWWLTVLLAVVAAGGRIAVPVCIQHALDHGLTRADPAATRAGVTLTAGTGLVAVLVAGLASLVMNRRLVRASEDALAHLRVLAFAHILRIAPARLADERRGSLVSRVTSDVDTVTEFTRTGGVTLLANPAQMAAAAVLMAVYSWPLTVVVLLACLPMLDLMRRIQRLGASRFAAVRGSISGPSTPGWARSSAAAR